MDVPAAGLLTLVVLFLCIAQVPPLILLLPVIFYVFSVADATPAVIFTIYMVAAGASDALLKPLFMGRGVAVPMPVILIGAIGGMVNYGLVGLFVGAVILAVWWKLFEGWIEVRR